MTHYVLIIQICVVVIIFPLLIYIFNREKSIMMTKEEHADICMKHSREMMTDIKVTISEKIDDLKEFINKDIKIAILEEMRNGRK